MNLIVLVGNLTKDPELRYTSDGKAVANLTIAVNRRFDRDKTDFFNIVVWGQQAESCEKYLEKGRKIGVNGRLQFEKYTDHEGIGRQKTEVIADSVEFLSPKSDKSEKAGGEGSEYATLKDYGLDDDDDEIPF